MFGLKRYFWAATSFGLAFKNVRRKKKKKRERAETERQRLNLKEQNVLGLKNVFGLKRELFWAEKKDTRELGQNGPLASILEIFGPKTLFAK